MLLLPVSPSRITPTRHFTHIFATFGVAGVAYHERLSYFKDNSPPIGTDRVGPKWVRSFCLWPRIHGVGPVGIASGETEILASQPARDNRDASEDRRFVEETGAAAEIAALAEPVLEDLGLRLVRVLISGRDGGTVQVMIDRAGADVTVEDCADASRAISPLLDAHDPMPGRYTLEVSSPGIDRPLVRPSDFTDWAGHEAKLQLGEAVDGRKRFRGVIEGYDTDAGEVRLSVMLEGKGEPDVLGFPVALIESAKLVMTDALMAASEARRRQAHSGTARSGEDDAD